MSKKPKSSILVANVPTFLAHLEVAERHLAAALILLDNPKTVLPKMIEKLAKGRKNLEEELWRAAGVGQ